MLADEPGVGKTPTALVAAESPCLVICPAVIQDVWRQHAVQWRPELDIEIVSYSSLCERTPNAKGHMVCVAPRAAPEYRHRTWATVICDEAHYLKERKTNWTTATGQLRSERLYLLTGTPLPNWAHEVFVPLRLMYPGDRRFTNYWRWVRRWFKVWEPPWGGWKIGGLLEGITWRQFAEGNGIPGHWLRRKLDDVLPDLPPLTEQTIEVPMTAKQATIYRRLKKTAYATLPDTGAEVLSWSAGGAWGKLWQASTGLEVLDPGERASGKLDLLAELLRERERPTLVFGHYRATCEAAGARARLLDRRVAVVHGGTGEGERDQAIRDFQAGDLDVLVGSFGILSEGVTLTATDCVIRLERSVRPSTNEQALRRIRRFGQTRPCLAIDLVTAGTVDAEISRLVTRKSDQGMAAMTGFDLAAALDT